MPAGAHTRPEGAGDSDIILLLWEYHTHVVEPVIPPPLDEMYPEIALRGMAALLPRFSEYFERMPQPMLDGGYYTKTQENRPLIGPLPVKGAYIIGALSGYGLMSACGAGDLLAAHITGIELPSYAPSFSLERYQNAEYQKLLEDWGDEGQL
jgi:glycine/D-amino acid oxidase-like deaminating enzyme